MAKDHNLVHLKTQRNIENLKLCSKDYGLHFAIQHVPGIARVSLPTSVENLSLLEKLTNLLVKFRDEKDSSKKTILFFDDFSWLFHDENLLSIFNYYIYTLFIIYPELKVVIGDDSSELLRKRIIESEHLKHKISDIIELKDFDFQQIKEFCGELDPSKIVLLCGMVGGNPLALDLILNKNIKRAFHAINEIHLKASFQHKEIIQFGKYEYNFTVFSLYRLLRTYKGKNHDLRSFKNLNALIKREKNLSKPIVRETGWDLLTGESFENKSFRSILHIADPAYLSGVNHMYRQVLINNCEYLVKYLGLDPIQVMFAKPYIIPDDKVDPSIIHLMIQTTDNTVYVCEIIYSEEKLTYEHADEFLRKVSLIPKIDKVTAKTVLISINGFTAEVRYNDKIAYKIELKEFFDKAE